MQGITGDCADYLNTFKEFIIINGLGYGGLLSQLESQEKKGLMILYRVNQHTSALKMLLKRRGDYLLDYRAPTTEAINVLGIESEIRFTTVHTVDVYVILGKHVKNARNLLNRIEKGYQQISK